MLPTELAKLGAIVDEAIAYRTVPETEDVSGGAGALPRGRRGPDHLHEFLDGGEFHGAEAAAAAGI